MFTSISWQNYFIVVGLTVIGWYAFIAVRYYSSELKGLLIGQRKRVINDYQYSVSAEAEIDTPATPSEDDQFAQVEELISKVKEIMHESQERNSDFHVLENQLQGLLGRYPEIKASQFRSWVSEFIATEGQKLGYSSMSESSADKLWH